MYVIQFWSFTYSMFSDSRFANLTISNLLLVDIVRYHCGGWSEELNSRILLLAYMVYL